MNKLNIQEFILEDFAVDQVENPQSSHTEIDSDSTFGFQSNNNKAEIDQVYQKAFAEGYEKAKLEVQEESLKSTIAQKAEQDAKMEEFRHSLEQSLYNIDQQIQSSKEKIAQIENDIVNISLEIAQKIIENEIKDKQVMENLIRKSLSFAKTNKVKLKLSATQASYFGDKFSNIEIIADSNLPNGSIIIEEDANIIDASIQTKLEELKRSLINDSE